MKKILTIAVLGLILFSESAFAKRTKWVRGNFYQDTIHWNSKLKVKLPPGEFQLAERFEWAAWGLEAKESWLISLKGKMIDKSISIGELGSWTYQSYVRQLLYEILYMNKYDGCYPRGEYTIIDKKNKGGFNNCFIVRHVEVKKELYYPDDPRDTSKIVIKKWIDNNNIELPSILICSQHFFSAPSIINNLFVVEYCRNPELNGASKSKFNTEETSEYHPSNIHQYSDKKKYMEEWIKLAAQRHRLFEQGLGAKERHKLDLSEYGIGDVFQEIQTTSSSSGLSEELKELDKLYKEGILTLKEFKKAKQKILDQ